MSDSSTESFSILKSSAYPQPIHFEVLKDGENLNKHPKMILNLSPQNDAYGNKTKGFNSFRLALEFPECLDEVDVISDADNIKTLLKLPEVRDTTISMLVHKVGNALLLDDFGTNIIKSKDDWKMFKPFLNLKNDDNSFINNEFELLSKTIDANYDDKMLLSNFLSYSMEAFDLEGSSFCEIEYNTRKPFKALGSVFPEPSFEHAIPLSKHSCSFKQNVVWNFAGIQMLVGTNTNIFKRDKYPSVSLKLKDVLTPFTSKTGKDYWLDNMMLDIPEVLICHHSKGFVKKYELIKTVDLPKKQNCRFSINATRNVAKNIINTLKAFVTNRGHTYWLYKGKDDVDLILYDLTSLCEKGQIGEEFPETPFTVPIAMLHYTLALKMLSSIDKLSDEKIALNHELLKYCVKLLPEKMYPEIMASVHYCLMVLYIPNNFNFKELLTHDSNLKVDNANTSCIQQEKQQYIIIQNIFKNLNDDQIKKDCNKPQPLFTSTYDRCDKALHEIFHGIYCVGIVSEEKMVKKSEKCVKQETRTLLKVDPNWMAEDTYLSLRSPTELLSVSFIDVPFKSWRFHLKMLLLQKACVVYAILYRSKYSENSFGFSLRFVYMALSCQKLVQKYSKHKIQNNFLFYWAAECFQTIICNFENIDTYIKEYTFPSEIDSMLIKAIIPNLKSGEINSFLEEPVKDFAVMVDKCLNMYTNALKLISPKKRQTILTYLGHEYNALSKKIVLQAEDYYNQNMSIYLNANQKRQIDHNFVELLRRSFDCLTRGLNVFQEINDKNNIAMNMVNKGFLLKTRAKIYFRGETANDFNIIVKIYECVIKCYDEGRKVLVARETSSEIWDLLHWDHCNAYLSVAEFIQDKCPKIDDNTTNLHKEAFNMLNGALNLCFTCCNFQEEYLFRQGIIYARIAAYNFDEMTLKINDSVMYESLQLKCQLNYKKALTIFYDLKKEPEYLRLQLERIEYQDFLVNATKNISLQIINFCKALDICLESVDLFKHIVNMNNNIDTDNIILKKMEKFEDRLQYILKNLIKMSINNKETLGHLTSTYKEMYFYTLHTAKLTDKLTFATHLTKILSKILEIKDKQ